MKILKRAIALILSVTLCLGIFCMTVGAAFENTHINTGNKINDIIAIARTQLGYLEGSLEGTVQLNNDCTKYGAWYGMNYAAWCAMFVSWCANQAGVPTTVIPKHASCDVGMSWFIKYDRFGYAPAYGGNYSPKRGDIVYFGYRMSSGAYDSTHVGIVYDADATYIHVLEGNSSNKVQTVRYLKSSDYILGYGFPDYSGEGVTIATGYYSTTATYLNFREKPTTSSTSIALIPYGTCVQITELNDDGSWGKTVYDGKTGWVHFSYLERIYVIDYKAPGATNIPQKQFKKPGAAINISASKPTKSGSSFVGWALKEGSSDIAYKPGDSYKKNADLTLYAIWDEAVYTVTYDANGGSGAPKEVKHKYSEEHTISLLVPTRNGYEFAGWSKDKTSGTVHFKPGEVYSGKQSITLYAVWVSLVAPEKYTVTYNANGGTAAPASQTKTEGTPLALKGKPSRNGYTFEGWAYTADAKRAQLFVEGMYTEEKDVTLYAVWCPVQQSLTLNTVGNGRVTKAVIADKLHLYITADAGESISLISLNSKPLSLLGDTAEYELIITPNTTNAVVVEFTRNNGLWINPYKDVAGNAWYYNAAEFCYKNDLITGVANGVFDPSANISRSAFVYLISRVAKFEGVDTTPKTAAGFTDINKEAYYYNSLCWAAENGLVSGTTATTFDPASPLKREQLVMILYNYRKFAGEDVTKVNSSFIYQFEDFTEVSPWAKTAVEWAVYNKYLTGSDGLLNPRATTTRAQTAQIIYSIFK